MWASCRGSTRETSRPRSFGRGGRRADGSRRSWPGPPMAGSGTTRLIYNLNVRTFVRAIVQYRSVDRNVAVYSVPVSEFDDGLFNQFLFSYKVNPQTVVFLGYSDNQAGTQSFDLTRTDRTFFAKVGYALRP